MGNLGGVRRARRWRRTAAFHSLTLTLPPLAHDVLQAPKRTDAMAAAGKARARVGATFPADGRARAVIEGIAPHVDGGRFAVKRVVGDRVEVEADCFADGHDVLACVLRCTARGRDAAGTKSPMTRARQRPLARRLRRRRARPLSLHGAAPGSTPSCRGDTTSRAASTPKTCASPRAVGRRPRSPPPRRARAAPTRKRLRGVGASGCAARRDDRRACGASRSTTALGRSPQRYPDRRFATTYPIELPRRRRSRARALLELVRALPALDRGRRGTPRHVRGLRGAPALRRARWASTCCTCRRSIRSAASAARAATTRSTAAARRCRQSVGDRRRRGRPQGDASAARHARGFPPPASRRARDARPRDRARHRVPVRARSSVRERASGVVPAAARRQRAVRGEPAEEVPGHLSVQLRDRRLARAVGRAEAACSSSGSAQGVRIFRVDNPHTKPFAFWEWAIARDQARASGRDLPVRGVHAAEGDASAGQARLHAVVHLLHLAQHQAGADRILHRADARPGRATTSGRTAGRTRPTSCPSICRSAGARRSWRGSCWRRRWRANYGIYGPAFELLEHVPREPGAEEYLHSEKYELRHWDLAACRQPRAVHRAGQRGAARQSGAAERRGPASPAIDNDELSLLRPRRAGRSPNVVLVVVNLDPTIRSRAGSRSTSPRSASRRMSRSRCTTC